MIKLPKFMSGGNIFLVLRNKIITYQANTKLLYGLASSSSTEPINVMIQLALRIMSYDYYVCMYDIHVSLISI